MKLPFLHIPIALLLLSCGGDSGTGTRQDLPPNAVASVFGANITTEGEVSVRSGTDVVLSAQSSDGGGDGPLIDFQWRQINIEDYEVTLLERGSNSRVFRAPKVPVTQTEGVTLDFELTVADADGVSASDTVTVRVTPALDADHFLSRPLNDEDYIIVVGPSEGSTLSTDVPITLSISRSAVWTDRQGRENTQLLATETLQGTVSVDAPSDLSSAESLYFVERIPLLNFDEVNAFFQGENRDRRLEFENVAQAELELSISLQQQVTGNLSVELARRGSSTGTLELIDTTEIRENATQLNFTKVWLQQQTGMESRISGENYYRCIDPNNQATTLSDWLIQAGFTDGENEADDVVHATYLNNYDLNFGRDMFLRLL